MAKRVTYGLFLAGFGAALAAGACSTGGGEDCTPGKRGCDCIAFECLGDELECINGICQLVGDGGTETGDGDGDGEPTTTGDGDGDPSTGDGDPTTGDGDGDPTTTGDGDGDPTTTGDGDGDPTTTGDGDGDPTTTGDGDGDPTTTGDGDGDPNPPLTVDELIPGDLVITEITWDPATCDSDTCEWFEIYNDTDQTVDLQGLQATDSLGNNPGMVAGVELLLPGEYVVLARGTELDWPFMVTPIFHGGSFALNNTGMDKVVIFVGNTVIDETALYTAISADTGRSWRLDPTQIDAVSNDDAANWCFSTVEFELGEFGTPGAANDLGCF